MIRINVIDVIFGLWIVIVYILLYRYKLNYLETVLYIREKIIKWLK